MKAAWVKDGIVENVSVWDQNSSKPLGFDIVIVEDDCVIGPGFIYRNGTFFAPESEDEAE